MKAAKEQRTLLLITPFDLWPLWQGTVVRTFHLITHFAAHHTLWLGARRGKGALPVDYPVPERRILLNHPQRFAQLFHPRFFLRLLRLARQERIDTLIVSQITGGIHGLLLHWLTGARLIFDNHNVEYLRFRRMGSKTWPAVWLLEGLLCREAAEIYVVSEVDRDWLARHFRLPVERFRLLPNGADIQAMQALPVAREGVRKGLGLPTDRPLALFFGARSHRPNAQAVRIILDEIAPRLAEIAPDVAIVIAGRPDDGERLSVGQLGNVYITGFVEEIGALIKSCDLSIVPLVSGSGTRLKILESVASGVPVVSTSIGAEGLDQELLGDMLLVVDGWEPFVRAVAARAAGREGRALSQAAIDRYDWARIFEGVELPG
ncbi:MAG: glycosyltransferase family 4 protein [Anaerolineales bacterium]|nr:glycosyltransferase family 4 protein [Anaerolineales bacterium]MCB9127409.1 glycosyltransferase family 4 protein [Ardenticatenales bacterium]